MRWIFISLLTINLFVTGYWYLFQQKPSAIVDQNLAVTTNTISLVLLNELSRPEPTNPAIESVRVIKGEVSAATSELASDATPLELCVLVGSFNTEASAAAFLKQLSIYGAEAQMKNLLVSSTVGFWLHLQPIESRKALLRRLSELQRQGVDSYIIPDGDLAYGISLGMFSDKSRAEALKSKIEQLGYTPEIAEVPRERRELWVFMTKPESLKLSDDIWSDLLSEQELLQKQQNLCSDVASA